jgi:hypothetical protein
MLLESLVSVHISEENSIILAVITCKDDIENQSIFQMAKKYDPSQCRTIGVFD